MIWFDLTKEIGICPGLLVVGGALIIGQDQDSVGGSFEKHQSYSGKFFESLWRSSSLILHN